MSSNDRTGTLPRERGPIEARFWAKVDRTGACWVWLGFTHKGYGRFNAEAQLGTRRAHKVAWILARGPVPPGMVLDHLCRNPRCVRPEHLEAVTQRENLRRGLGGFRRGPRPGK